MSRHPGWCITLNNYTEEEVGNFMQVAKDWQHHKITYMIVAKEVGSKTETPHLQGYVAFVNAKTMKAVKKLLGTERVSLRAAKGSDIQNEDYCDKGGIVIIRVGMPGRQGKRTDLDKMKEAIGQGKNVKQMITDGDITSLAALKSADLLQRYLEAKRDWKPKVIWIWGEAGTGKSKLAAKIFRFHGNEVYRRCPGQGEWWDGYDGQPSVWLDDLRESDYKMTTLLSILDRYEHRVPVKGGFRQLQARLIIITSITHPRTWYLKSTDEPIEQLRRRVDEVLCCK